VLQVAGLPLDRAKGLYVWLGGEEIPYLDLVQGYSTTIFGHCDEEVVAAAFRALSTADHVMAMPSGPREELASLLSVLSPVSNGRTYFDVGGAQIVSIALRLARRLTRRTRLLALAEAFHGYSTEGEVLGAAFIGGIRVIAPEASGIDCVTIGSEAALGLLQSRQYAAFVAESIQGANGLVELPREWIRDIGRACAESETLLVFDEVQVGVGRTGTFAASERYGVTPDIVVYGKALCGGVFPLSAMVVSEDVYGRIPDWPASALGSTFSCSPFGCAVGVHVVGRVKGLLDSGRISDLGAAIQERLRCLVGRAGIRAIRCYGLAIALDFADAAAARGFHEAAFEKRILTALCGARKDVIKIYPPYTTTDHEASRICNELESVTGAS
jgi:acetylornithine/succinyldiaminopimelate/putrescine aminotransferase